MKYLIDTNVFLRALVRENEEQFEECKQILQRIEMNSLSAVCSGLVLNEVVWTLQRYYKYPKEKIVIAGLGILNLFGKNMYQKYDYRNAFSLFSKYKVPFVDCCIASIREVHSKEWTIVSYDVDFKKLPVLWKTPKQILKTVHL